jgi:hypothetical protein
MVRDRNHVHGLCSIIPLAFCHALFSGSEAIPAFWLSGIAEMLALSQELLLVAGLGDSRSGDWDRQSPAKC